jgi:hypothetical protein
LHRTGRQSGNTYHPPNKTLKGKCTTNEIEEGEDSGAEAILEVEAEAEEEGVAIITTIKGKNKDNTRENIEA